MSIDYAYSDASSCYAEEADSGFCYKEMILTEKRDIPWKSKGTLNRIGNKIRLGEDLPIEELLAFETWRAAHSYVLNTFKPILWSRVINRDVAVAQRLKRRSTIFDKLLREPGMELSRMDDIAGCRLIFKNMNALNRFRTEFHKARFKHKLKHSDLDKYDYVKKPKTSGYRGVHEIYTYNVNSDIGKKFNGLYVEIQFRTIYQHAWATAVEVIGRLTTNQPKFNRGDALHIEYFQLASEIIARTKEGCFGPFPEMSNFDLYKRFLEVADNTNIESLLEGISVIKLTSNIKNNVVLQLPKVGKLKIHKYFNINSATEGYFQLEKEYPDDDIVLVRAKTFDDIQSAYRNYFQNATDFTKYVKDGFLEVMLKGNKEQAEKRNG